MKKGSNINRNNSVVKGTNYRNGTGLHTNGFLPNSLKFISSCIKTVSSNVKSASVSVAGSISGDSSNDLLKDQVLWASFDRLQLGPSVRRVLLIGYANGFQVLDVDDASNVSELVSRRDDPVTFMQTQPLPKKSDDHEGYMASHPILVVASDETSYSGPTSNGRDGVLEHQGGTFSTSPTSVRFYSLRSHNYVHVLRFRSTVYMVRCSPQIVAVGLSAQIYCFDALTLENKFSVLTYPVPQLGSQGINGANIGYGPMAVGPRWLAYASNNPLVSNTGRLSPQSLSPSPGVSPSTSPGNGTLVARYAMESSKQLAAGLINLGDMGYKTLSKYCHDFRPDGSNSPVSSNASWKAGRTGAHPSETDAAGTVIIKDIESRAVISQFRAHTSPISALCFDPSGTLLVTASIHGNNINIYRIMPSRLQNGSGIHNYESSSSHVHLYKLHRGMTSAVIQDICFSQYSQWVAIVSSRGTCHIFVLSPFGGDTGLQLQNSRIDGPILLPIMSLPWWSTSSFVKNQLSASPPPGAVTLSVVCRIKSGGWLHMVSNAASSVAGKVSVPSGVVAAEFYNSVRQTTQSATSHVRALEHLLVYSPSGHLIQYQLIPSVGGEEGEYSLKSAPSSLVQASEDDLGVKIEPVQWWDVCRRADWPEREEYVSGMAHSSRETVGTMTNMSLSVDHDIEDIVKAHERSHWYLSNAEVQLNSGRTPIWQKSQVHFYTMSLHGLEEQSLGENNSGADIDIEKIATQEVEIRRRELLPVFEHFRGMQYDWSVDRLHPTSDGSHCGKEKTEETIVSNSEATSIGSLGNSHAGSSQKPSLVDGFDQMDTLMSYAGDDLKLDENDAVRRSGSVPLNPRPLVSHDTFTHLTVDSDDAVRRSGSVPLNPRPLVSHDTSTNILCSLEESYVVNNSLPSKGRLLSTGGTDVGDVQSSEHVISGEISNRSSNQTDESAKSLNEGMLHEDMHDPVYCAQYSEEGYCKASANSESHELVEAATDGDSTSSPYDRDKAEEDGESDCMLGGVFSFSEEG